MTTGAKIVRYFQEAEQGSKEARENIRRSIPWLLYSSAPCCLANDMRML